MAKKDADEETHTAHPRLSQRLRELRQARGWTLGVLSERSGISVSSLSKVENGQISMTYDNLIKLARGFDIELGELFAAPRRSLPVGRRAVTRRGTGAPHETAGYVYELLGTEMSPKRMVPMIMHLKARTLEAFGPPLTHAGEEFIYVLKGSVLVHLEGYRPTLLSEGDSIYVDSRLGHAYLAAGEEKEEAIILGICSDSDLEPKGPAS